MLFKVSYTNDERQSLWQSLPLSQQWRGQLTRHKIATVHVYLTTRTGPSSTTSKCTTRSTEIQYIRGPPTMSHIHLLYKNTLKSHVRLVSILLLIWSKNNKTLKITRPLPPRSLTYFIKQSGTNPMATILPRHPYWPKIWVTLTYRPKGLRTSKKKSIPLGPSQLGIVSHLTPPPLGKRKMLLEHKEHFSS